MSLTTLLHLSVSYYMIADTFKEVPHACRARVRELRVLQHARLEKDQSSAHREHILQLNIDSL